MSGRTPDPRRRPIVMAVVALVVANLAVGGVRAFTGDEAEAVAPPVTEAPTTTTTTLPPLGEPVFTPGDGATEPLVELGTITIPAIGLEEATTFDGIALSSIDHGPGHWPGTAMPGHLGNTVFAGHRITHSHPFRKLDELKEGDQAILTTAEGTFVYSYTVGDIVTPDRTDIATQTPAYTATFFACHPPGSLDFRIVAHWKLVSAPAPGQPDPAILPPV
ncbi:MAG: class E sortase [Acidimicrobiales bacterium]